MSARPSCRSELGLFNAGGVELAAVHHRHDLAARQNCHRRAERPEQIGRQPLGPVADALDVVGGLDLLLEPAERLGRHRKIEQADEIELEDVVDQLAVQRLAAARIKPRQHAVRVPAERRRAAEQRRGLVLAIPGVADAVAAIEDAGMHGILHLEGRNDRAGGEHIEFQPPAGHLFDGLARNRRRTRGKCPATAMPTGTARPRSARATPAASPPRRRPPQQYAAAPHPQLRR